MILTSQKATQWFIVIVTQFLAILTAATSPSPWGISPELVAITTTDLPPMPTPSSAEEAEVEAATTAPSPALECTSEDDNEFKFVLSTSRNSSGYWLADMDLQPGEYARAGNTPFEVHLEHRTQTCVLCHDETSPYAHVSLIEPPPARVPKAGGYLYFPGFGFYKRHLEEKSWYDARDVCKEEGTDLVVINSEAEAKLLLELSAPLLFLQPAAKWNAEAYVGIYDIHDETDFVTVTGIPLNDTGYVHWSPGEPNNHREEDCVTIVRNAMYNDVQCSKIFEFICELSD